MKMEEGEDLISLIRLGRQGAVEATKVRIAGYSSVLDGASVPQRVSGTCQKYNRGANLSN